MSHPEMFVFDGVGLHVVVKVGGNGIKLWMAFPKDQWEALSQDPVARDSYIKYKAMQLIAENTEVTWRVAE